MRIKVVYREAGIPGLCRTPLANARDELVRLGMTNLKVSTESKSSILGEATWLVFGIVQAQGWVESAEVVGD